MTAKKRGRSLGRTPQLLALVHRGGHGFVHQHAHARSQALQGLGPRPPADLGQQGLAGLLPQLLRHRRLLRKWNK